MPCLNFIAVVLKFLTHEGILAVMNRGLIPFITIIQRKVFVIFQICLSCNKKLEKVLKRDGYAPEEFMETFLVSQRTCFYILPEPSPHG